jgi:hypothetical protein
MILLIKLILAHLIGDFVLQPASWVRAKEKNKLKAYQLYLHSFLHFGLIILLVWDKDFLLWAALLAFIHLVTDAIKLLVQKNQNRDIWFFADQLAHVASIYMIFCLYNGYSSINASFFNEDNFMLATTIVFLTVPASVIIKVFINRWSPDHETGDSSSLENAGKYIGMLERLFVFAFVITSHWEGVGFLLAAKSVFRFGDLKESKDRKLTEYILIGTLLSFGIAMATGMAYAAWKAK